MLGAQFRLWKPFDEGGPAATCARALAACTAWLPGGGGDEAVEALVEGLAAAAEPLLPGDAGPAAERFLAEALALCAVAARFDADPPLPPHQPLSAPPQPAIRPQLYLRFGFCQRHTYAACSASLVHIGRTPPNSFMRMVGILLGIDVPAPVTACWATSWDCWGAPPACQLCGACWHNSFGNYPRQPCIACWPRNCCSIPMQAGRSILQSVYLPFSIISVHLFRHPFYITLTRFW